jgi:hypothetical protein
MSRSDVYADPSLRRLTGMEIAKGWAERGDPLNAIDTNAGLPRWAVYGLTAVIFAGTGLFLFGAVGEPQRTWANLLAASFGVLGLGLGAAVWLALFNVTGARWSEVIRPVTERLTLLLPVGAIGVALVLVAAPSLYPWTKEAGETASTFQGFWLRRPFFLLRAFVYLALWLGLAFMLVRASRRKGDNRVRISAVFLVIFGITFWLASVDWIMSLEPKWSSTIFGVYHFAGMVLAALAGIIIVAIWFEYPHPQPLSQRARGGLPGGPLTNNHLRDLGTLLFSFSSFWAYIWFCQYLLIWYVNNPEEAEYFVRRQQGAWQPLEGDLVIVSVPVHYQIGLFLANVVLNWGVPFVVLLFRPAKESPQVLLIVAGIVLLGRALDLYLMVLPADVGSRPAIADAGLFAATIGLAALIVARPLPLEASILKL